MTSNKDLEQIAKQVSLLNRVLELLRMQENSDNLTTLKFTLGRDFNSKEVQKAWSDELVNVARELKEIDDSEGLYDFVIIGLQDIAERKNFATPLETILNKYGRSLSE